MTTTDLLTAKDAFIRYENEIASQERNISFLSWISSEIADNYDREADIAYDSVDEDA